ncbi:cilia- and flagella-associated protein 276 [Hyperolius riggenbachi]|uniref:cilia- and flagella-associated protein 276 n=1 Tax=Hyperolius riggenbachi TaxID=752182 RepID=UPI0035A28A1F
MPSTRDPYPYPQYENDNSFQGKNTQNLSYVKQSLLTRNEDAWNRLNGTPTLSSSRRAAYYSDPESPSDSLDFNLKSLYNHHDSLLKNRNETVFQLETFTDDHGRILKNRVKELSTSQEEKAGVRQSVSPQKISVYSIDGAITSHHTAATNRGYSRKQDGGYYSI